MGAHRSAFPSPFTLADEDLSLATDLYELTMAAAYFARSPTLKGTFELFVWHLPEQRNFLIFAGLEQALASLRALRFSPRQVEFLKGLPPFGATDPALFEESEGSNYLL
jgi:nicotinate phosphoribosyltransferase